MRIRSYALLMGFCAAFLLLSGAMCPGRSGVRLRSDSPPGATADLQVGPLYGKTDSEAELARRCIWTFVPAAWLSGAPVVIASAEPGNIAAAVAGDKYASAGFDGRFTGNGFTSFAANRKAPDGQPDTIYLSMGIWSDPNTIAETALHEWGHVFYYRRLSAVQQSAWRDVWKDAANRKALPTDYAATNEFEGFAESFSFYCGHRLKDAPTKAWFDALPR